MVKYPPRENIRRNLDITVHGLCTHISKDLHVFIKKQILKQMDALEGLSLREVDVLMCVAYFNEAITSSDVADTIRYDPATVTRATYKLVAQEYLTKVENQNDARSELLQITDKGSAIAAQFREQCTIALESAESHLSMALTYEEQEELLRLLLKMRERSMQYSKIKKLKMRKAAEDENVVDISGAAHQRKA